MKKRLYTSESVTEGHPDKVCDQISDAILDAIIEKDMDARVACEVCATTGMVLVMGEISTSCYVDITSVVRETIKNIGYNNSNLGFDYKTCAVLVAIDEQSCDIAQGVNNAEESRGNSCKDKYDSLGAGDQGMMFGYATAETKEFMPLPVVLAHKLAKKLAEIRKQGIVDYLYPDGKSQVSVEYDEDNNPLRIDTVVIASQHNEDVDYQTLIKEIKKYVIDEVIPAELMDENTKIHINPTGRFVRGGPYGDSGLTGRKIIVDTYGGFCPHGGGAFSGKDPTKVDRSASYMARYVCKNVVAAGLAKRCQLELSYAIGRANPISFNINTFKTGILQESKLEKIVKEVFDFRPAAIIEILNLAKPQYLKAAAYGHFGRDIFTWEKTDKIESLLKLANLK